MKENRIEWAQIIDQARRTVDMTQQQLAEAAGVSLKTVGNIEKGESAPQPATLRKVREALGLSSDIDIARKQAVQPVDSAESIPGGLTLVALLARIESLEDAVRALQGGDLIVAERSEVLDLADPEGIAPRLA